MVAKRLKYRRKPWSADANHFHHRMARIGFCQRKTVAYLYGWTLLLAGVAVALRLIPHSPPRHAGSAGSLVVIALVPGRLAASVYLVYVLEIFKFKGLRTTELRRAGPRHHRARDRCRAGGARHRDRRVRAGAIVRAMEKANLEELDVVHHRRRLVDPRAGGAGVDAGPPPEPGRGDA